MKSLKRLLFLLIICVTYIGGSGTAMAGAAIVGAGASFPYPLYTKWALEYAGKTGVKVFYQSAGSSEGLRRIKGEKVDFAATDVPLGIEDLKKAGLVQFPMAIGGVVPVVNLEGVYSYELQLTPDVLADIFLGKIAKWNDKRIARLNPHVKLPDGGITVVHRSDGSGTTWLFTNYLSKVSKSWRTSVGFGTNVNWPAGIGKNGNEGVAAAVESTKNSIGYVEYAYALRNRLKYAKLENKSKAFVQPFINSFMAAARSADWQNAPGYAASLTDQSGAGAWPITGATYILVRKDPVDCSRAKAALEFFDWAYKDGSDIAEALVYMPVPKPVYELMEESWANEIRCDGKPVWVNASK